MTDTLRVFDAMVGPSISGVTKAIGTLAKVEGMAQKAITLAFVTILAADPSQTPANASKLLADRCKGVTEGSANVMRSRARKACEEPGVMARIQRDIPASLTLTEFLAACDSFSASFDVRKMEAARKANLAKAAENIAEAAKAQGVIGSTIPAPDTSETDKEPATPLEAALKRVLDIETQIGVLMAELLTFARGDDADVSSMATDALYSVAYQTGLISQPEAEMAQAA